MVLEDMDTSESEHIDESDDYDEWEASDPDTGDDDSEWAPSEKQPKRHHTKTKILKSETSSARPVNPISLSDSESQKMVSSGEGDNVSVSMESVVGVCCSCSRSSSCKTMKCECRAIGSGCSMPCGCTASKCSNREVGAGEQGVGLFSGPDEKEKSQQELASHGAMLLQTALSDKPTETKDECGTGRKPLSDIGNTLVCLHFLVFDYLAYVFSTPAPIQYTHTTYYLIPTQKREKQEIMLVGWLFLFSLTSRAHIFWI